MGHYGTIKSPKKTYPEILEKARLEDNNVAAKIYRRCDRSRSDIDHIGYDSAIQPPDHCEAEHKRLSILQALIFDQQVKREGYIASKQQ